MTIPIIQPVLTIAPSHAGTAYYPKGSSFGPRTLSDYEFVWIISGSARWIVDKTEFPVAEGSVFLACPSMRDRIEWAPLQSTQHGYLHFQAELDPELRDLPAKVIDFPKSNLLLALLQDAERRFYKTGGQEEIKLCLAHALHLYYHDEDLSSSPLCAPHPAIRLCLQYFQKIWASSNIKPISLESMATAAKVSAPQLNRLFQRQFSISPVKAQLLLRLDRACDLLLRSNESIKEISYRCGFESPYHFSRSFKLNFGQAPLNFRSNTPPTKIFRLPIHDLKSAFRAESVSSLPLTDSRVNIP